MRSITLSKSGLSKIRSNQFELKLIDFEDSIKSCQPGEWVYLKSQHSEIFVGFVNPLVNEKFNCAFVVQPVSSINNNAENCIVDAISRSLEKRKVFKDYQNGCRLFYGSSDGLNGLIIDKFKNCVLVQINTAGIDSHRVFIKDYLQKALGKEVYFLDNPKYRERECLPKYECDKIPNLLVEENNIQFELLEETIQKIGFYYDHRENRAQLLSILDRLTIKLNLGVDLFSYVGAWGLTAIKAGVKKVDFVDQGNFEETIKKNLTINNFADKGKFYRSDVFHFLDKAIIDGRLYDVLLCDPPAFTKSPSQKKEALEGYSKLHRKVFKIAAGGSLCCFSSCTQYVNQQEFEQNILEAAKKEKRRIQLLHQGIQGWDHPISSILEKSSYIKSLFYLVE